MNLTEKKVLSILETEKYAYIATTDKSNIDNAVIAFANEGFRIYFGAYSDTLKCRNLAVNPAAALCISTLQIHGTVKLISHGSPEFDEKIKAYSEKFPAYARVFSREMNELYEIIPSVIWNYDPVQGEMFREKLIFDAEYYEKLDPYESPGEYDNRKK